MCGIFGSVGDDRNIRHLVEGLQRLEYRGYDSAGIAWIEDGGLAIHKSIGRVGEMAANLPPARSACGISHTRWATHGGVTNENAHPHLDPNGRVAIVHNGIIDNADLLRSNLERLGATFESETDSEILAHLISRSLSRVDSPVEAVRSALKRVRGTWGLAVIFADHPEIIVCARNGSPLVVGLGKGETFVSSDPHALIPVTRDVVFLEDGDVATLTSSGLRKWRSDGEESDSVVETIEDEWELESKGDHPHFMHKEIHEQPRSLRLCISGRVLAKEGQARLGGLHLSPEQLQSISHVRLLGCGTAFHAAQIGASVIERLARVPASAHIASEFRHGQPVIDPNALYFAVSQSGETADTLSAVKEIQLKGGHVMGVVNVVGSSIARACGQGAYIHSGPEQAVASTKAFSNMVAALTLFGLQIGRSRDLSRSKGQEIAKAIVEIPSKVELALKDPGPIDDAVRLVAGTRPVLFLGRGQSAAVAREGALKLMEVAYVPCLAYPAAEMKHGPIALLEEGSTVVVVAPNDELKERTLSNIQECRARGASIILVHTTDDDIAEYADVALPVPKTHPILSGMLSVLPLQLLAYGAGLALGCDIDRPRNLAKSVTVE